jgi:NAD-dependent DNA ligase
VYISNNDFRELNEVRKMKNETVFSTARNAAAGSLRTLGAN